MNKKGQKYFNCENRFKENLVSYFNSDVIDPKYVGLNDNNFPPAFFSIVALFAEDCNYNLKEVTLFNGILSINGVYKNEENCLYLRYRYSNNISLVVAKVKFIHKRQGYMTKLYEILKHIKKVYQLNEIVIECANTDEIKNWCKKNGLVRMPNILNNYISKSGYNRLIEKGVYSY